MSDIISHKFLTLVPVIQPTLEYIINTDGALAVIIRDWLPNGKILHERLIKEISWIQGQANMFGKITDIPRAMFFLGDPHVTTYSYGRHTFPVQPWNQQNIPLYNEIAAIRTKVQNDDLLAQLVGLKLYYNSCLLNFYRDGTDKIDPHSDKEALGPANAVITVSLGGSRSFIFKSKIKGSNGRYPTIKTVLNNGDLVLMAGRCQELWTHGIPREETDASRISLTYRLIKT
jgi:alkylated DNA repair dioxygenase AlkB